MNPTILLLVVNALLSASFAFGATRDIPRKERREKFFYAFLFAVFSLAIFAKEYNNIITLFSKTLGP